jgi:Flp pilus assembly protein TadB
VTPGSVRDSRRYDVPPLWLVPILLIVVICVVVFVSLTLGALGFIAGLVGIFWLQRKADAYVRARDSSEDD